MKACNGRLYGEPTTRMASAQHAVHNIGYLPSTAADALPYLPHYYLYRNLLADIGQCRPSSRRFKPIRGVRQQYVCHRLQTDITRNSRRQPHPKGTTSLRRTIYEMIGMMMMTSRKRPKSPRKSGRRREYLELPCRNLVLDSPADQSLVFMLPSTETNARRCQNLL